MRKVLVASAISALIALTATPVAAKVQVMPEEAVISGPGIDAIHLDSGPASGLVDNTGSWDTIYGGPWLRPMDSYEGELGPRYVITYTLTVEDHARPGRTKTGTFTHHIYPFASDGPVQVVPAGQTLPIRGVHEMAGGWSPLNKFSMQHLEYYGIPKTNPLTVTRTDGDATVEASVTPYLWALVAVLLVGVGVLGDRRVRASRRPAA